MHISIWEEDGVYIAKCMDIPGCVSEGSTRDEALANIHDAINLCLSVIRSSPNIEQRIEEALDSFRDVLRATYFVPAYPTPPAGANAQHGPTEGLTGPSQCPMPLFLKTSAKAKPANGADESMVDWAK